MKDNNEEKSSSFKGLNWVLSYHDVPAGSLFLHFNGQFHVHNFTLTRVTRGPSLRTRDLIGGG